MGRRRRIRHAAVAAVLVLVPALSGCVATHSFMPGPQADVIGDVPISFIVCASGSTGCPSLGLSGIPDRPRDGHPVEPDAHTMNEIGTSPMTSACGPGMKL